MGRRKCSNGPKAEQIIDVNLPQHLFCALLHVGFWIVYRCYQSDIQTPSRIFHSFQHRNVH